MASTQVSHERVVGLNPQHSSCFVINCCSPVRGHQSHRHIVISLGILTLPITATECIIAHVAKRTVMRRKSLASITRTLRRVLRATFLVFCYLFLCIGIFAPIALPGFHFMRHLYPPNLYNQLCSCFSIFHARKFDTI